MTIRIWTPAAALALCACISGQRDAAPQTQTATAVATARVPVNLDPPPGNTRRLTAVAKGVQIYKCAPKPDATGYEWTFTAPQAELFDQAGTRVGTHYAGPTWELTDGSKVVGAEKEKAAMPGTIPWVLLSAKSSEGNGKLAGVTFIQRVDTAGGAAPTEGCDAAHSGEQREVPYTANYHFYGP
jgi:hypothetical protein